MPISFLPLFRFAILRFKIYSDSSWDDCCSTSDVRALQQMESCSNYWAPFFCVTGSGQVQIPAQVHSQFLNRTSTNRPNWIWLNLPLDLHRSVYFAPLRLARVIAGARPLKFKMKFFTLWLWNYNRSFYFWKKIWFVVFIVTTEISKICRFKVIPQFVGASKMSHQGGKTSQKTRSEIFAPSPQIHLEEPTFGFL